MNTVVLWPVLKDGGVAEHLRQLRYLLTKHGWQVHHTLTATPPALLHCHAVAQTTRPPDVFTCHGIYPLRTQMPVWQVEANRTIMRNLKLAQQVIAVSRWSAAQWQDLVGRRPHIIYNAVVPELLPPVDPLRWRQLLHCDERPLVVWGKTSVSDVLNPTPLLELATRYEHYCFVAPLPPGSLFYQPPNLTLVGPQPFTAMQELLAACDVYLATVCENHSIQVLEAMYHGKPILGYDWGGTAETVPSSAGVLVAPGDLLALAQALPRVYAGRYEYGAAARAHVLQHFSGERMLQRLLEVYEMTNSRGRPPSVKCAIVIPVYNKADYVAETLRSALSQEQVPYEVIIVNDGSTDQSVAVIQQTLQQLTPVANCRRVRFYDRRNAGVAAARNFGIKQTHARYICCLDADDTIESQFLLRLSAALDADPELGIAYSDMHIFGHNDDGTVLDARIQCSEYDFKLLLQRNFIPCCNLFRREVWERTGGYKDINPSWEDYELWLSAGKIGWYGRRVPGFLFNYRKLPRSGRDYQSHGQEHLLRARINRLHRDLYAPLISIIIPCYRQASLLAETLASVATQTFADWEAIVVDDGNADAEAALIEKTVADYDGVRLLRLTENRGLANARNVGCENAKGTWLVPLDSDDVLAPTFLEQTWRAINADPRRFVYTDTYLWWPERPPEEQLQLLPAEEYDFDRLLQHISWPCTILVAKEAWRQVGGYKTLMSELGGWEDWEFAINLGVHGICGVRVPLPLFYYRQHSKQQMRYLAEAKKPQLQEALRRLYAPYYRGERPMPCCGAKTTTSQMVTLTGVPLAPSSAERVLVRYTGQNIGLQTWRLPSGNVYEFSRVMALHELSVTDAEFLLQFPFFERA